MGRRQQRGQAGVETIGVAMALAMAALIGWQVVVALYAWQTAASAARSAARAGLVGAPAERAALGVMPSGLARRTRVQTTPDGGVSVWIGVPRLLPGTGDFMPVEGRAGGRP